MKVYDVPRFPRVKIDPALRGHASPHVLRSLERRGFRVHRVGQAVYAHHSALELRFVLGAWPPGTPPPSWAHRLTDHHRWLTGRGGPTALQQRRTAAYRALRDAARLSDGSPLPWWCPIDAAGRPLMPPRHLQPWRYF